MISVIPAETAQYPRSDRENGAGNNTIRNILESRLDSLRKISRDDIQNPTRAECSRERFVYISEYPFGNSGNHVISLSHGLWVAVKMNATLIVPDWIANTLKPFNLTVLSESFCFTLDPTIPKVGTSNFEITSEDSFFAFKLFQDEKQPYLKIFPPLSNVTIMELSTHFLRVYAGLWCCPQESIVEAATWLIDSYLSSDVNFTAVHKRGLDGGCNKLLSENTHVADFEGTGLPMHSHEWSGNLHHGHPLCEMSLPFVNHTMQLHSRAHTKIFVAFDGVGDVALYRKHHAVFSGVLEKHHAHSRLPRKYLDMFLAMHGGFFIMNPRSTFSWQIFMIRVCLDLPSVPILKNNDVFLQKVPEDLIAGHRPLWVSWMSVMEALHVLRK